MAYNKEFLDKIDELEQSGVNFIGLVSNVPFGNVLAFLKVMPVSDLVDLVELSPSKLIRSMTVIYPDVVNQVPADKLKVIVRYGNMDTVQRLQESISKSLIVFALRELPMYEFVQLLQRDDFLEISDQIFEINGWLN